MLTSGVFAVVFACSNALELHGFGCRASLAALCATLCFHQASLAHLACFRVSNPFIAVLELSLMPCMSMSGLSCWSVHSAYIGQARFLPLSGSVVIASRYTWRAGVYISDCTNGDRWVAAEMWNGGVVTGMVRNKMDKWEPSMDRWMEGY